MDAAGREPEGEGTRRARPRDPALVTVASEAIETLAPEWAALHAAGDAPPFSHPAWHAVWLRHFSGGADAPLPVFLAFRDHEERLIGVVPLDLAAERASFLGDHNVCDYAGLLAEPGREPEIAVALLEWLMEDMTPRLDAWGLRADSPWPAALATAADAAGWGCTAEREANAPTAALPPSWDEFAAALPKHDRHELRRKLRHLEAGFAVTFTTATGPEEVQDAVERLLAQMRASRDDKAAFLAPAMEAFFRDLAATLVPLGLARLETLALDGVPAATLFAFESRTAAFLYNSGYDPAHARLAAGLLSKALAIRGAIARGKRTFDFLRGEEDYKRHLGGQEGTIVTLRLRST